MLRAFVWKKWKKETKFGWEEGKKVTQCEISPKTNQFLEQKLFKNVSN